MSEEADSRGNQDSERLRVLAEAMAHPLRGRLLQAVSERSDQGVSITQLSVRLGEPKRKIRYHIDALENLGLVEIASERNKRGVIERFYRVEQVPFIPHELDDRVQSRLVAIELVKSVLADASAAIGAKVLGMRPGHALIRLPGEVDQQGWDELTVLSERILRETQAVLAQSGERLKKSQEAPIPTIVALLLFEVPPWPEG